MDDSHNEKPAWFEPSFVDGAKLDPLAPTHADFDWGELERLLGEAGNLQESDRELLGDVLHRIIAWMVASPPGKIRLNPIGRKIVALAWVLNPGFFDGKSLSQIARESGLDRRRLSDHAAEVSRHFKIRRHGQSHGWNFKPSDN